MKARLFTASILSVQLASVQIPVQDKTMTGNDPYSLCISEIRSAPQDAYNPCKQYLEQSPSDDAKRIQYVNNWLTQYEKVRPYVQFLKSLTADQEAAWFVYEPDLVIQLPQTSEEEGLYKIQIGRSFTDRTEEDMLRKAEAVYPGPGKMIQDVFTSLRYWANESPKEMVPIWGVPGNDNIQLTSTVTARAVRYYYDLTLAARRNPHLPTGFTALSASLNYKAEIKYFSEYTHLKDVFRGVYVADLTLEWAFICGGLCGMGFTRNKVVVLDSQGNVIALYQDAPVNSQSWVS